MLTRKKASKYLEMHTTLPPPVVSKTTPSTKQMEEDQMEDTSDEEVIWVQCDREECLKWRKLPHTYKISTTEDWYCDMHPDPIQKSCDIPEEKCKMSGKKFFTYSWFPAGQLVWAKMIGYPQWPAMVTPDPWCHGDHFSLETDAEGCIYHIEFLGKPRSHVWMSERQIVPFHRHQLPLPESKRTKRLSLAIKEAEDLCGLSDQERVQKCEFVTKNMSADNLDTNPKLEDGKPTHNTKETTPHKATHNTKETTPRKATHKSTKTEKVMSKAPCSLPQQLCVSKAPCLLPQQLCVSKAPCLLPQQLCVSKAPCLLPQQLCVSKAPCLLPQQLCVPSLTYQSVISPCMVPRPNPSMGCHSTQSHTGDSLKDLASLKQTMYYDMNPKSPHINTNPHTEENYAHDQIVPSITDQDEFSNLESSILNEWKEIENLCTITESISTMQCDISSILSDMQNIEDFIQVINEDNNILPT